MVTPITPITPITPASQPTSATMRKLDEHPTAASRHSKDSFIKRQHTSLLNLQEMATDKYKPLPAIRRSYSHPSLFSLKTAQKAELLPYQAKLIRAVETGNLDQIDRILAIPGLDPNFVTQKGDTALTKAATRGRFAVVERLLKVPGININHANNSGNTALMLAAGFSQKANIVSLLMQQPGIQTELKNHFGSTALALACKTDAPIVITQMLRQLAPGFTVY